MDGWMGRWMGRWMDGWLVCGSSGAGRRVCLHTHARTHANKSVVALFNAITKARQAQEEGAASGASAGELAAADLKLLFGGMKEGRAHVLCVAGALKGGGRRGGGVMIDQYQKSIVHLTTHVDEKTSHHFRPYLISPHCTPPQTPRTTQNMRDI